MRRLLRLSICAALLAAVLVPAATGRSTSLAQQLAAAIHSKKVNPAKTGAVVYDLQTGSVVYALHAELPLHPASNEKLATTYAALAALGPSFQIETDVLGNGTQNGTTWRGDIVLKGYGDPTLSRAELWSLAHQVARDGIRHVKGRVIGDESWFDTRRVGLGWKREFYLHESPALSALIVDRGWDGRAETQPALYAAQLFRRYLVDAGVSVRGPAQTGTARDDATALGYVVSPPVASARPLHGHVERQLHGRDAPEAGRGRAARRGDRGRRRRGDARAPQSRGRVVAGDPDRRRLGPLAHRPLDSRRSRRRAPPDVARPRPPPVHHSLAAGRRRKRDASLPNATQPRVRRRPREDGHDRQRSALSGFVGNRYVFSIVENGYPIKLKAAMRTQDAFAETLARAAKSSP